jgi:hypothetical protein
MIGRCCSYKSLKYRRQTYQTFQLHASRHLISIVGVNSYRIDPSDEQVLNNPQIDATSTAEIDQRLNMLSSRFKYCSSIKRIKVQPSTNYENHVIRFQPQLKLLGNSNPRVSNVWSLRPLYQPIYSIKIIIAKFANANFYDTYSIQAYGRHNLAEIVHKQRPIN